MPEAMGRAVEYDYEASGQLIANDYSGGMEVMYWFDRHQVVNDNYFDALTTITLPHGAGV